MSVITFSTKRLLALIVFLSLLPVFIYAQSPVAGKVDSLYRMLPALEGEKKLAVYTELSHLLHNYPDTTFCLQVFDAFAREAKRQKNAAAESLAIKKRMVIYAYSLNEEAFMALYPSFMKFAYDHKLWDDYFYMFAFYSGYFLKQEQALEQAQEMYAFSSEINSHYGIATTANIIGNRYIQQRRPDEAEPFLRQAIAEFKLADNLNDQIESYSNLCISLRSQEKYDEFFETMPEWEALHAEKEKRLGAPDLTSRFYIDIIYAETYSRMEQFDNARRYFDRIAAYIDSLPDTVKAEYLYSLLRLHINQDNYQEGLALIDTCQRIMEKVENERMLISVIRNNAYLLTQVGRDAEAVVVLEDYIRRKDAMNQVAINDRLDELRSVYEVDRLTLEKEKLSMEKQRNRSYLIGVAIGCILLFCLLSAWIFYSHRLKLKNVGLVSRIQEQDRMAEELEKQTRELRKYHVLLNDPSTVPDEDGSPAEDELLERLKCLVEDKEVFTNPSLNRKTLAEQLNTNEEYLRETIHKNYGKTFAEFITGLRLNYSRELLAHDTENYTIEGIAIDSGFGSRNTFHRLFRKQYGLSPDEYRRLIKINTA
ncbi:helix-turn-helix domain-containing protein [Parabacteroides sp. PF5-6]|uniref:helix-turn-helix domain-containing protein n=1 Tax=Parabacteroides sp. PF5-6 TaxID=1742403 RepID=UPI002404F997|nr:helix-turn-helix domain-containing protein [Parabacteroides sp. PF5-6]MDF9831381.1 AraC-like DNA-binding protein/adenylate kinase family enzyme [Parabacteroides sp. PF5-6]